MTTKNTFTVEVNGVTYAVPLPVPDVGTDVIAARDLRAVAAIRLADHHAPAVQRAIMAKFPGHADDRARAASVLYAAVHAGLRDWYARGLLEARQRQVVLSVPES